MLTTSHSGLAVGLGPRSGGIGAAFSRATLIRSGLESAPRTDRSCRNLQTDSGQLHRRRPDVPGQQAAAQMSTNTTFRQRRLVLLGKAGVERILLDAEWDDLLRNFADDTSLYAARSETAREAETTVTTGAATSGGVMPWWLWGALTMAGLQLALGCP